jgi:SAM-dependent methyltransferase
MTAAPHFKDHFSGQPDAYERYRPGYPAALFDWLAAAAPTRELAVDIAAGNGQAAVGLAGAFASVIAVEPSAAQLRQARPHPRIDYRQGRAEALPLPPASADLAVAAQAAHWFDWAAFVAEARRVLRPGGVLAVWCYGRCEVAPAIDRLVEDFSRDAVGPGWPRERRHVDEGYRGLATTLAALEPPAFEMQCDWDIDTVLGYLGTWSAVQRCRARSGRDPLALLAPPLAAAWGEDRRRVRWPLALKAWRA